jgi:hypothetical protein
MPNGWITSEKPPHGREVEVMYEGQIIKGKAIWGDRDRGVLPHWELENGIHVHPSNIKQWRYPFVITIK